MNKGAQGERSCTRESEEILPSDIKRKRKREVKRCSVSYARYAAHVYEYSFK